MTFYLVGIHGVGYEAFQAAAQPFWPSHTSSGNIFPTRGKGCPFDYRARGIPRMSPTDPSQTAREAAQDDATVPPPGYICPVCRDNDMPAFDGDVWYCARCDGHTDGGVWQDATYVRLPSHPPEPA